MKLTREYRVSTVEKLPGESKALVSGRVESFGDEFHEDRAVLANQEKMRERVSECSRSDHF